MKMEFLILGGLLIAVFLLVSKAGAFTVSTGKPVPFVQGVSVPYGGEISEASKTWGVNSALIKAIIRTESNFDAWAENIEDPKKDYDSSYGLMQVRTQVAQDFGVVKDWKNPTSSEIAALFSPQSNVNLGTRFLSKLLGKYPLETAIQMYNVGEAGFNKGYRNLEYLARVKRFYNEYKI